jgi:serine/threonine protein kinase
MKQRTKNGWSLRKNLLKCDTSHLAKLLSMNPLHQVFGDRYQIQSLLSHSAKRRTWLATDMQTQTPVVVKLLLFGLDMDWQDLKLFEREVEALKTLQHPAIPTYLDYFEVQIESIQGFALVQSYIPAKSLEQWVQAGRSFSEAELKTIAQDLLTTLDYLHQRQPPVVHRDIKPSNILLADNRSAHHPGQVYLVDFGSVQTVSQGGTITVVGTYGYMPPEQFGGRSSPASDLYSLGVTLIYLATGQHPADLPQTDSLQIEFAAFANLSPSFQEWLHWLTQPKLSHRPASAQEALQHFDQVPVTTLIPKNSLNLRPNSSHLSLSKTAITLEIQGPVSQFIALTDEPKQNIVTFVCGFVLIITLSAISVISAGILAFFVVGGLITVMMIGAGLLMVRGVELIHYFVMILQLGTAKARAIKAEQTLQANLRRLYLRKLDDAVRVSDNASLINGAGNDPKNTDFTWFGYELKSLAIAPSKLGGYQITFTCDRAHRLFYITGDAAEIAWLCQELSDFTGLPVQGEKPVQSLG